MILPQLSADGLAVRLPILARAEQLLDDLALAYADDAQAVGALLTAHAANVGRLEHAVMCARMPEGEREMRAAAADGSREELLAETPVASDLDDLLDADQAVSLASQITRLAGQLGSNAQGGEAP